MNKNIITLMIGMILLIGFTTAFEADSFLNTFENGQNITLFQSCATCTFVNLTSIISNGGDQYWVFNIEMTKNGTSYDYIFTNSDTNGEYYYTVLGDSSGSLTSETIGFKITPNGKDFTIEKAIIYSLLLVFLSLFLVFGIYGTFKADSVEWFVGYLCFVYIMLFSLLFIGWYFADNYAWEIPMLASTLWILWIFMGIMFLPFIIIISSWLMGKTANEKNFKTFMGMGYTKDEALSLSKNK